MNDDGADWALPAPADPSAGASAEARHSSLARHGNGGGSDDVALAELIGPMVEPEPGAARSWARGAAGERLTAQVLAPLGRLGWAVLHDRRLPGGANIDHLLIGPGGVWVVDSKAYAGRIKVLRDGRLWYGKVCLDKVLGVLSWAADLVGEALDVPVASALCIHGARLPRDPLRWDGAVLATAPVLLPLLLTGATFARDDEVAELAATAVAAFPPARTDRQGERP